MITSFNFYYAHPGREQAVLRQRRHASDVRQKIGLARGRVLERVEGASTLPDVIWELRFDDVGGHHADMAVRAASAEFEAVRAGMRVLCRRFERPLFEHLAPAASDPAPEASEGAVALDWIFCPPDRVPAAIATVEAHARSLAQHGLDPGVILRLITPGNDLPDLIWQHEYAENNGVGPRFQRSAKAWSDPNISSVAHRVEHSLWSVHGA